MEPNLVPAKINSNINTDKKEVINIRKEPFCLASALTWWQSKDGECISGSFNLDLYKDILEIKYKM